MGGFFLRVSGIYSGSIVVSDLCTDPYYRAFLRHFKGKPPKGVQNHGFQWWIHHAIIWISSKTMVFSGFPVLSIL
jgi:hypothetical protein